MPEKDIFIEDIPLIELYGINDSRMEIIKEYFPGLKIVARGDSLRISGSHQSIESFSRKIIEILEHYRNYHTLYDADVERIMQSDVPSANSHQPIANSSKPENNIIVHGNNGLVVKARTRNQQKMVDASMKNDLVFAVGPAGTGKTYTAVALAVRALKNKEVRKIILTRPAVEAGESLGFLPGDLKEKLDPYLQPLYDALYDMLPMEKLHTYLENKTIEVAPLAFMRGRTLNNAFVILDEGQNTTENQMKMFLTRMGSSAKFIVTGDTTQIDLPFKQPSGLIHATQIFENVPGIDIVFLDASDVVRHKLVRTILGIYAEPRKKKTL